jgi:hypothetical protein
VAVVGGGVVAWNGGFAALKAFMFPLVSRFEPDNMLKHVQINI